MDRWFADYGEEASKSKGLLIGLLRLSARGLLMSAVYTVVLVMALIYFYSMYSFFDAVGAHCRNGHGGFSGGARRRSTGDAHGRYIRILF